MGGTIDSFVPAYGFIRSKSQSFPGCSWGGDLGPLSSVGRLCF